MRLSALVIAVFLVISITLLAEYSWGAGGNSSTGASSSGGHSGGGSSGGGFSSAARSGGSSHAGSGSPGSTRGSISSSSSRRSNSSTAGLGGSSLLAGRSPKDPASTGLNIRPNLLKAPVSEKLDEQPEKKGLFSFLHHKKPAPEPATFTNPRHHCKTGQICTGPVPVSCQTGRFWKTSSCAQYDQYSWFGACRALADELTTEQERMRLDNDPGESLRYQMLLNQYRQCMGRFGGAPFSSYLFSDASFAPYF
jgi:hypothetical protein